MPYDHTKPEGWATQCPAEAQQPRDARQRTISDRISRLRVRAQQIPDPKTQALFLGLLDLLADEL